MLPAMECRNGADESILMAPLSEQELKCRTGAEERRSCILRIGLNHHRAILAHNRHFPASRRVTRWQRIALDLINMVASGIGVSNGGLDLSGLGHVSDL